MITCFAQRYTELHIKVLMLLQVGDSFVKFSLQCRHTASIGIPVRVTLTSQSPTELLLFCATILWQLAGLEHFAGNNQLLAKEGCCFNCSSTDLFYQIKCKLGAKNQRFLALKVLCRWVYKYGCMVP